MYQLLSETVTSLFLRKKVFEEIIDWYQKITYKHNKKSSVWNYTWQVFSKRNDQNHLTME